MKYSLIISSLLLLLSMTSGCKKDPPVKEEQPKASLKLNIEPEVRGNQFGMDQSYYNIESYRYKVELFKFYLSHITLIDHDGISHEVSDVALFDFDDNFFGEAETFTAEIPLGTYTQLKFGVGVDSTQNHSDPSVYSQDHALSVLQGTHWSWNTGYRFIMLEGRTDTVPNGGGNYASSFAYHTGTNALYKNTTFGLGSTMVDEGEELNIVLSLDMNKLFYNDTDTIRIFKDNLTHTTDNFDLADQISNNFVSALSLSD